MDNNMLISVIIPAHWGQVSVIFYKENLKVL